MTGFFVWPVGAWARPRRDIGLEAQNDAAEIVLMAERRLGGMLADLDGHGSHGGNRKSSNIVLLEEEGITKMQSHRWQTEARVPEDGCAAVLTTSTTTAIIPLMATIGVVLILGGTSGQVLRKFCRR